MPTSVVSSVEMLAGAVGTLWIGRVVGALQEKNVVFGSDEVTAPPILIWSLMIANTFFPFKR